MPGGFESESGINNDEVSMEIDEPSLASDVTPRFEADVSFAPQTPAPVGTRSIPPSVARTDAQSTPGPSTRVPSQQRPDETISQEQNPGTPILEEDISMSDVPPPPTTPARRRTRASVAATPAQPAAPTSAPAPVDPKFVTPRATQSSRTTRKSLAVETAPALSDEGSTAREPVAGPAGVPSTSMGDDFGLRWKSTQKTLQLVADRIIDNWT
jgi:hypothetical protein